jgi:hypothetical protein
MGSEESPTLPHPRPLPVKNGEGRDAAAVSDRVHKHRRVTHFISGFNIASKSAMVSSPP